MTCARRWRRSSGSRSPWSAATCTSRRTTRKIWRDGSRATRGDWIASRGTVQARTRFAATLAWLDTEPAIVGRKYWVRHGHRWVQARITAIESRLDIHSLAATDAHELAVNEIGNVIVETQQPLPLAPYASNRVAGALIVVDPTTHRTSGALLVSD